MDLKNIKYLIETSNYKHLLKAVQDTLKLDINEAIPPLQVLNFTAQWLEKANIRNDELEMLMITDKEKIISFTAEQLSQESKIEEFRDGEEQDVLTEDESNVIIEPFYKDFMIMHAIKYFFLKNRPSELGKYLKAIRFFSPKQAKQYERELVEIYAKISK